MFILLSGQGWGHMGFGQCIFGALLTPNPLKRFEGYASPRLENFLFSQDTVKRLE